MPSRWLPEFDCRANSQSAKTTWQCRLRYCTALLVVGDTAFGVSMHWDKQPKHQASLAERTAADLPRDSGLADTTSEVDDFAAIPAEAVADLPSQADEAVTWTRVVGAGGSLSGLLFEAGLGTEASREVTRAIGSEFNLRYLKPGQSLALKISADGLPETATLEIEDGSRILATFGDAPSVQRLAPHLDSVRRAGEATVGSSIFAALDKADIPTRFATDLELILAGTFDLRSALADGERIRLMWREYRSGDRVVGDSTIDFAQLDLADGRNEILWTDDNSRRTRIFKDGQLVQTFDQPIRGARLTSAFGMRMHPIHGYTRMQSCVDFAAEQGAVVMATQAGKVAFMGKRSGYGNLVELDHGDGVQTLYAHLSDVNGSLQVGQRVAAGAEIGRAGSSDTSTSPHLHYEIHFDCKAVSPLADTRLRGSGNGTQRTTKSLILVGSKQSELDRLLATRG